MLYLYSLTLCSDIALSKSDYTTCIVQLELGVSSRNVITV